MSDTVLVVDLDGTLVKTDLLVESLLSSLKRHCASVLQLPFWLLAGGKPRLKDEIARRADVDVSVLPYNEPLLDYLREQKAAGRRLALATASHETQARAVADHLQLFDDVFASDAHRNLKAGAKAEALEAAYGAKGFVYAGNEAADLEIWKRAAACVVVGASASLRRRAEALAPVEAVFDVPRAALKTYAGACRPHQWLKNALVFVPLLGAHRLLELGPILATATAFAAFSLCASSAYLLNDLLDLNADRHHRKKRMRPFASGAIPPTHGLVMIPSLLLAALGLTLLLPLAFAGVLVVYYAVTTAYSLLLKKKQIIDVVALAGLYTTRIVAGAAATGIVLSEWLLGFSMFIFLSLALAKRYTELIELRAHGVQRDAKGRGYGAHDIELLASLGGASGYISVLVFALYLNSDVVRALYPHAELLWAVCPLLLYWISRVWLLAHRGEMNDDPVVFAIKDRISRYTVVLVGALFALALV